MKAMWVIAAMTIASINLAGCSSENRPVENASESTSEESADKNGAELTEIIIPVSGMTCTSCSNSVESAVKKVAGIDGCSASYTDGTAKVRFDARKTNIAEIVDVINKETSFKAELPTEKM